MHRDGVAGGRRRSERGVKVKGLLCVCVQAASWRRGNHHHHHHPVYSSLRSYYLEEVYQRADSRLEGGGREVPRWLHGS